MARVLAVADEVADALYGDTLDRLKPDLILSCGDLPFEYLENLVTRAGVPLLYVLGNHDPDPRPRAEPETGWPFASPVSAGRSGTRQVPTSTHRAKCGAALCGCRRAYGCDYGPATP